MPLDSFFQLLLYFFLSHFTPDWLNDYSSQTLTEGFGFVDCGQRGSWTVLHRDVYESYSWSAQIVGRKL
jgi:hypothetical protein